MNYLIPFLVCFPLLVASVLSFIRNGKIRQAVVCVGVAGIIGIVMAILVTWCKNGYNPYQLFLVTEGVDQIILLGELLLMVLVIVLSFKHKKYWISLLSMIQTLMVAWLDVFGPELAAKNHLLLDRFSLLMLIIVSVVGGLICIYAVGYMHGFHQHHKEFKDRRPFFFFILFVFLGAMFGLVLSSNLLWMDFFWEVTSVCSFLLIGYTQTEEAIHNSFRALWMNLLGGLGLAIAIFYSATNLGTVSLQEVIVLGVGGTAGVQLVIALLAFAGLTKSAQLPFSTWLLGAMVAPTPTSALLHSATMVKAGVYLLIRLSPALHGTMAGTMVSFIGGFTFLAASMLAISQSDGKKVLAYSTVSNLGLITACAGIGVEETVWAAIFLLIFHAVSKSMLFQDVGAVENSLGSRNIEDMTALILRLPRLSFIMIVGIAGMFLAPFGMLISKWAALKAFVDTSNTLLVIFIAYGSATTMFYWTKWLGKILCFTNVEKVRDITKPNELVSLFSHAVLMIGLCLMFPFLSVHVVEPMLSESELMIGTATSVLPMADLQIMIIMLCSVFIFPAIMIILSQRVHKKYVISYMSGANTGDSRHFVDSMGESKELKLSNWYMEGLFGEKKLLNVSLIISAGAICILLCIILGGVC